jgi:predicted component of type VI protein secretion system
LERRELRTGKREPLPRPQSLRIAIIGVAALLVLALLVRIATRPQSPAATPAAAQPSIVTVTVPLPVTVDRVAPAPVPATTTTPPTTTTTTTVASAPVEAPRAASQKPARVAVATERTPGTIPTAAELAALYRDVGHTLEQLDRDRADSLWQRYRWIRIGDYLMSPDKRAEAAAMLDAIASDARGK